MKSRMPSHSSGKFCSCDREGRCWRNTFERGDTMLFTTELMRGLFVELVIPLATATQLHTGKEVNQR